MDSIKLEDKYPQPICKPCQGEGHRFQPEPGSQGWRKMVDLSCPDCSGTGLRNGGKQAAQPVPTDATLH